MMNFEKYQWSACNKFAYELLIVSHFSWIISTSHSLRKNNEIKKELGWLRQSTWTMIDKELRGPCVNSHHFQHKYPSILTLWVVVEKGLVVSFVIYLSRGIQHGSPLFNISLSLTRGRDRGNCERRMKYFFMMISVVRIFPFLFSAFVRMIH